MSKSNNKANIWHEEAMDLAEMALFAKIRKDLYSYWKYLQRALNYEKAAAKLLSSNYEIEPSRSVLYKGAVHFAINLDHFEEARQLLNEVLAGDPPEEMKIQLEQLHIEISKREQIRSKAFAIAQGMLEGETELDNDYLKAALETSIVGVQKIFGKETIDELLNRIALEVLLEQKNLVSNPDYHIFEERVFDKVWLEDKKTKIQWSFWKAYKIYLDKKGFASTTIKKLDLLTDDILARIGDPLKGGKWDKRGMIVGDVQSGKTSNYIGLINKAADLGFRITIVLTGLYESLRQQTQERIDEGFIGSVSDIYSASAGEPIGVELYRKPSNLPVHPITRAGEAGDLRKGSLANHPMRTNDYYAIVVKKNPAVLKTLLNWLYIRGDSDGEYKIIKNIPLLVIDDEADYASINVDREFVSKINASIRAILSLFEQSAFIGYTATPFANVFISDHNTTQGKEIYIEGRKFRLGEELFPKDFIINLPPPSNYIGYSKVFDTQFNIKSDYTEGDLPMVNIIDDFEPFIPKGHRKDDILPDNIPPSLKYSINCFFIVCAVRLARGQQKEHNSMLVHVSWYVQWIDRVASLVNQYVSALKASIRQNVEAGSQELKVIWEREFKIRSSKIVEQLNYDDPLLIAHDWEEIAQNVLKACEKIEVRAVHGSKKNLEYLNTKPLDYNKNKNGLSVIAVGGNKLSRGLTLEGLSISYFLRATRFYDTLLQMGRWFGYRPGYVDLCRLFTTEELVTWYQYIANATEELKEQFDIMDLAERTPQNFGIKVRSAPGMLMISSAAKIKGATDLSLSYSGDLQETYVLPKSIDIIENNIKALTYLLEKLGPVSGMNRQGQKYIWENIRYNQIDDFISEYRINQSSIHPNFIRGYIGQQLKRGNLNSWTIVLINNQTAEDFITLNTSHTEFRVGYTLRKEVEERDVHGNVISDQQKYLIRKSHIISPPHEYLDMDDTDQRLLYAKDRTIKESKAKVIPPYPAGKYIRKYRGAKNALFIIYVLDPKGFGGKKDKPAIGFAISFPEIENDEKIPYKVNQQFIEEMFEIPNDAEENPEEEGDDN